MDYALTKRELADLAGFTYRRLHQIDCALPPNEKLFVEAAGNANKYDLKTFIQRWVDWRVSQQAGSCDDLETVKAKHEAVKMRKTEIEVARLESELIPLKDVEMLWTNIATVVNTRLVDLPRKVAPALVMIGDAETAEGIIEVEIKDALNLMRTTPIPEIAPQETDDDT